LDFANHVYVLYNRCKQVVKNPPITHFFTVLAYMAFRRTEGENADAML